MIGDIVGSAIVATSPGYPSMEGHEGRLFLGLGVALGSIAVGLALGIPGIIKMVRATEVENQALEMYSPTWGGQATTRRIWPESSPRYRMAGKDFMTPVMTLTF